MKTKHLRNNICNGIFSIEIVISRIFHKFRKKKKKKSKNPKFFYSLIVINSLSFV